MVDRAGKPAGRGKPAPIHIGVTFEMFPFPEGLTIDLPASDYADDPRSIAIARAAAELLRRREAWLNPAELVRREAEVAESYPDRILPVDTAAGAQLRRRTLNTLYNTPPTWLLDAHADLDAAVEEAYGWPTGLSDQEILGRLLAMNDFRSAPPPAVEEMPASGRGRRKTSGMKRTRKG